LQHLAKLNGLIRTGDIAEGKCVCGSVSLCPSVSRMLSNLSWSPSCYHDTLCASQNVLINSIAHAYRIQTNT